MDFDFWNEFNDVAVHCENVAIYIIGAIFETLYMLMNWGSICETFWEKKSSSIFNNNLI